ncbi:UDP-glucose 4-epimerase family protein [Pseudomonas helleri]|uniref:NAD-dependent epimerase/dehydratase family protein n=1 Tax=Pseudomonas helleri TaxID=1608996 RepID=A0A7X1XKZ1_9PSED|nr:SDR family oxidoreductase [Pseudomonas helleri]MQT92144.1 NAD-dependent epimerase/dehydratase family protein [Pseudomonas helleri]
MSNNTCACKVPLKSKLLITGGSGFVGSALLDELVRSDKYYVVNALRKLTGMKTGNVEEFYLSTLSDMTNWLDALQNVDVVIHSAARVHVMNELESDPLQAFRAVNVDATMNLAKQAVEAKVRRFIFISSIKVNGEETSEGKPFTSWQRPEPLDDYGRSKLEAEQKLLALAQVSQMEVVIIRPVLVYGPGVKANFEKMIACVDKMIPLPLLSIANARSLVFIENLVDLICVCINHKNAANQVFLVSDGVDYSTVTIFQKLAKALHKHSMLFPFPVYIMKIAGLITGKKQVVQRLCGSLQVDISRTKELLDWTPPVNTDEAFIKTVEHYKKYLSKL